MSPKNRRNGGNTNHNTRSKSKTREGSQGASTAVPDSNVSTTAESTSLTNSRDGKVPASNQNKRDRMEGNTAVSSGSNTSVSTEKNTSSELLDSPSVMPDSGKVRADSAENITPNSEEPLTAKVSDNRDVSIQTDFPPEFQRLFTKDGPIMIMFEELKVIRTRLDTVDKIEVTTSSLDRHFKSIEERTCKLEEEVKSNSNAIDEVKGEAASFKTKVESSIKSNSGKIKEVSTEMASLKEMVEIQGLAIAKLTTQKKELIKLNKETKSELVKQNLEFTANLSKENKEITGEMNKLIQQQKQQVDSLQATTQHIEEKILEKTEERMEEKIEKKIEEKVAKDSSFQNLKDKAFENGFNIIITGLEENSEKSTRNAVFDLLKSLGEERVSIIDASRLGSPRNDTTYHRPMKVKFSQLEDRNRVWRKRRNIANEEGARKVKIQADLPKELRDEMNILYRITRAAGKMRNYKSVTIRNFAVSLNGKEYGPKDLEKLPFPIRPSTISNPKSESATVFFSKYSVLSNHHPSTFTLQGDEYQNMEHYLATKRAMLSGQQDLIQWASQASDPKKAKAILYSLRENNVNEWDQQVEEVTINGLRAKFSQNKHLLSFLKSTGQLQIGEASTNPRWGIGLDLDSPDVLDTKKWDPKGNLLGRSLMKIRDELCSTSEKAEKKSNKKK